MALLQGSLRTLIAAGHRGSGLIGKLNTYLCENIPENRLVTLFYGEVDAACYRLHYVNAGHNAPILMRADANLERLPATCTVLGIDKSLAPEELEAELGPGSRLLLFTDGVTEAFSAKDEEYGESRLTAFIRANQKLGSAELIKALVADVLKFCGAAHPTDDMTLMSVTCDQIRV
jgi:sigma-B regulation protein RsbU (phosphoserine phosphatase)